MASATEIVGKLEEAVKKVTTSSQKLQEAQKQVEKVSDENQKAIAEVNNLRSQLDQALNEQISAAGVAVNTGRVRQS